MLCNVGIDCKAAYLALLHKNLYMNVGGAYSAFSSALHLSLLYTAVLENNKTMFSQFLHIADLTHPSQEPRQKEAA